MDLEWEENILLVVEKTVICFFFKFLKKILTLCLNELGLLESLMSEGSLFHSLGPREEMVL